jgi:FAD/FMN-containing dehydrogenase
MNDVESSLTELLGADAVVDGSADRERYLLDWTRTISGHAEAIVRPSSVDAVSRCMAWSMQHGLAVVPQGGHTGLAGGATPTGARRQIVLSLERLNRIRAVDGISNTITVEAGAILQNVQQAAAENGRLFPLSLGAEGSCQIGGCIASNAGGTAVVRYGNMRELVLGLEAVLPDGSIWSRLRTLRKDNAGFDLKHLFIGTEGTLGIVTAATLRLFPRPRQRVVAFAGVQDARAILDLFVRIRDSFDAGLTGFEFMTGAALRLACAHSNRPSPIQGAADYGVLIELTSPQSGEDFGEAVLSCLAEASEGGTVVDAVFASNEQQADSLWALRESIPEAMLRKYPQFSAHDVSLPIARIPEFIGEMDALLAARWPNLSSVLFGHVGDGNLHLNFVAPAEVTPADFARAQAEASDAAYLMVRDFGGSISAEHGIGSHKLESFHGLESPQQLDLMRTVKAALDPQGLMNPGKVFRTVD